ncbi:hypothetical protein HDV06_002634, partial [Boothiomyces sp. JEL0866]
LRTGTEKVYFKCAVMIAKYIRMNTEDGLSKLSFDEKEKENIRRIWWFMYQSFSVSRNNEDMILCRDNQLFLPQSLDKPICHQPRDYFLMEGISNDNWYVSSVYGLAVDAVNIDKYIFNELCNNNGTGDYALGCIIASIKELIYNASDIFANHISQIVNNKIQSPEQTWVIIFSNIHMNCLKINVVNPKLLKHILVRKAAYRWIYFKDAFDAAILNAQLIQLFLAKPWSLEYLNTYFPILVMESAFLILIALKLKIPQSHFNISQGQLKACLDIHYQILLLHAKTYNREATFYYIMKNLEDFTVDNIALRYGELKANNWHFNSQKPQPEKKRVNISELIN